MASEVWERPYPEGVSWSGRGVLDNDGFLTLVRRNGPNRGLPL